MIILIASLSVMVAYFTGSAVMGDKRNAPVKVQVATPISTSIEQPDKRIFNSDAINPAIQVIIGGDGQPQTTN